MALSSASGFSDYFENAILSWFKGNSFPAAPTTVYVGLFTANPGDTGTTGGTADGTEVTTSNGSGGWSGYARIAVTAASGFTAIAAATGDATGQQISVSAATGGAGSAWVNNGGSTVTITGIGIWGAASGGTLFFSIPLAVAQAITNGAAFGLAASGLTMQVD